MTCQAAPPVWGHALLEELRDFLQERVYEGSYVPQYQDGIFKKKYARSLELGDWEFLVE